MTQSLFLKTFLSCVSVAVLLTTSTLSASASASAGDGDLDLSDTEKKVTCTVQNPDAIKKTLGETPDSLASEPSPPSSHRSSREVIDELVRPDTIKGKLGETPDALASVPQAATASSLRSSREAIDELATKAVLSATEASKGDAAALLVEKDAAALLTQQAATSPSSSLVPQKASEDVRCFGYKRQHVLYAAAAIPVVLGYIAIRYFGLFFL